MFITNQKGLTTELHCQLAFTELGIVLYQPITADTKTDFIADINNKLYKIQCKTASVSAEKDFIRITCIANGYHHPTKYTNNDVDFYYTWYNNKSYLIPFFDGKSKILRFSPAKNGNIANVNWAKDYELETVLTKMNYQIQNVKSTIITSTLKSKKNIKKCPLCNKEILQTSKYCSQCQHIMQQTVVRPSREELKKMIREKSFVQIGKIYSVSDNAIRKWCKSMSLPSKKNEIKKISDKEWVNI